MSLFAILVITSFAVYACLKWWFDTDILDHISKFINKNWSFQILKERLREGNKLERLILELFECPWCLSFHFSLWVNILMQFSYSEFHSLQFFIVSVIATAGGGMFLWQNDLKE